MRRDLKVEFRPGAAPLQQDVLGKLSLPGETGAYASTPHVAALAITEELDVRIDMTSPRWAGDRLRAATDHQDYANVVLAGKYEFNTERSWVFFLTSAGAPGLLYSGDGVNDFSAVSDFAPYVRAGGRTVLRVRYENDGVGDLRVIRFEQGWSIDGPWVVLDIHVVPGALSLFNATGADLEVGSYTNGGPNFPFLYLPQEMEVHRFQVRDGIDGTIVADADFSGHTDGTTSFTDDAGLNWTINGDAHVSGDVPVPPWVDITDRVLGADWRIGRERDSEDWPPGEGSVILKNEDRAFDPDNTSSTYFGQLEPRTPFRFSAPEPDISALHLPAASTYLNVPFVGTDNVSTPASSAMAVEDGIDVRVRARHDFWVTESPTFVTRAAGTTDGDFSWKFRLTTGRPQFEWSPDGTNVATATSLRQVEFASGDEMWLRATFRGDDGFGTHEVRFFASTNGDDWIELPPPETGTGSNRLWGGSRPLTVGPQDGDGAIGAEVLQVQLRDLSGRIITDTDFTQLPTGTTSFTDATGNEWTLNGGTTIEAETAAQSWASTPDHNDFDLAGNMNVTIEATLGDWRPGYDTVLASKWDETGNQRSWIFGLTGDGHLIGVHSTTGADEIRHISTVPVTPGPGGKLTVRAFFIPDFLGSSFWQFFTSTDGVDGTFTQLGATVTIDTSPTTLFASTATPEIGTFNQGSPLDPYRQLTGYVHRFEVTNGSTVTDVDFTADHAGDPSVTGMTGKVWTLQGDAELVTDPASVGDQFYGFVEDGWEQDYRRPAEGSVTVQLTDLFGVLPNIVLPSVFEGAIVDTVPRGYWRLNEAQGRTGEEVSDQSEQQNPGAVVGTVTFGEHALAAGLGESALFDKGDQGDQVSRIDISRSRVGRFPYNETVVCVLRTDTAPPQQNWLDQDFILQDTDGNFFASNSVTSHTLSVWHTGEIRSQSASTAVGTGAVLGRVITDGQPHLVFATRSFSGPHDGIGVDTPLVDNSTIVGGLQVRGSGTSIAGLANAGGSWNDNQFNGTLQHVALWDRPLTQADRDHIYDAYGGLADRRSDEQLRWAFNQIGVPDEFLDLDEGVVRMAVADSGGKDALDFAREVMSTEGSALFVDHHNGKIRFYNRYRRWLHHRSAVPQVAFTDDPATTAVRVEESSLRIQPRGVSTVVNIWTVTWAGGEEVAKDEDSIRRYGPRGDQLDTQAPTSAYARGLARWMLSLTKEPRTLVQGFGINPAADVTGFPAAVTSQVWDRTSFRYQPLATGSVLTRQTQIEGVAHQVEGTHWQTDFFTSTAADEHQQLFLADISETDGTDVAAP